MFSQMQSMNLLKVSKLRLGFFGGGHGVKYCTLWGKASYSSTDGLTEVSHKFPLKNRLGKFSEHVSMAPGVQASPTMMGGRSTGGAELAGYLHPSSSHPD